MGYRKLLRAREHRKFVQYVVRAHFSFPDYRKKLQVAQKIFDVGMENLWVPT